MSIQIQINQLNKYFDFGNFHALKNIQLDIPKGNLTALLGSSGCGKTTLLRIIAGLETATSGQILFDGADVSNVPVRERQIGFMFQHYALFRNMSVAENVAFGLDVKPRSQRLSKSEIQNKVNELLKLVQLEHLAKSYPTQLSGGQQQRIALARALATEPKVLLLDEPFGALDAKVRKELRAWLRQIQRELGITTILVTHDQEEALEMADQIIIMNQGMIEQIGSGNELYHSPKTVFVNEFLGESNVLDFAKIENGKLWIGNYSAPTSKAQNQKIVVYIRPHELSIHSKNIDNSIGSAIVDEIQSVGAWVQLKLHWNDLSGSNSFNSNQSIRVNMLPSQFRQNPVLVGDVVWLVPQQMQVFSLPEMVEYVI